MSYGGPSQNQYGGGAGYYDQQGQGYPPQQGYSHQPQQGYYPPEVSLHTRYTVAQNRVTQRSNPHSPLVLVPRAYITNFPRYRVSRLMVSPSTANIQVPMTNKAGRATLHSTSKASILPKAVLDTSNSTPSNSTTRKVVAVRAPHTTVAHPRTRKDSPVL